MNQVWKYPIPMEDEFWITLPDGARVLSAQAQYDEAYMWVLVDPDRLKTKRRFRLAGTGHPIEDGEGLAFVGTFQLRRGALVFHLFEYLR